MLRTTAALIGIAMVSVGCLPAASQQPSNPNPSPVTTAENGWRGKSFEFGKGSETDFPLEGHWTVSRGTVGFRLLFPEPSEVDSCKPVPDREPKTGTNCRLLPLASFPLPQSLV